MPLINDITDAQYKALAGVNFSSFKNFLVSPYHFVYKNNHPEKETDDLVVGNAIHTAVLQPHLFDRKYAVAPKVDRRKTEDKLIWNEFVASSAGKTVLTDEQFNLVLACSSSVKDNRYFKGVFDPNDELYVECAGNCEFAGSVIKGRIDLFNKTKNIILDIKSCKDFPDFIQMRRYAENRLHYMQGFFYREIVNNNFQLPETPTVVFLYIHKKEPFTIGLSQFGPLYMDKAECELSRALCRFENCKVNNVWPEAQTSMIPTIVEPYGVDTDDDSGDNE